MLNGKAALVTGAGRGIGRSIALMLARKGARVIVNDMGVSLSGMGDDSHVADQVAQQIRAEGGAAAPNVGSVTNHQQAEDMVEQCVSEFGRIDIVVHAAGILRDRPIADISEEEWDAVVDVHLKGAYNVIQPAVRHFQRQRSGRIVGISSSAALGSPMQPSYAAAKAAILGLIWSCANAFNRQRTATTNGEDYDVTANAVVPYAATRMIDNTALGRETHARTGKWPSEIAPGTERDPDNIASLVTYLASDAARAVNGQVVASLGFNIALLPQPRLGPILRHSRRWEPEELADLFPSTIGAALRPPHMTGGALGLLPDVPDEDWIDVTDGISFWRDGAPRAAVEEPVPVVPEAIAGGAVVR